MRKRIYEIIEVAKPNDRASLIYDKTILILVVLSILQLCKKQSNTFFDYVDQATAFALIADYLLRWLTADIKHERHGAIAFLYYPLTPYALVDLMAILPSFISLHNGFKLFRLSRIFRAVKLLRYSRNLELFRSVLKKQKKSLITVCYLAGEYILLSALIIFCVEPESFDTFFDAIYWAVVTLTTVGYGDIYPVSYIGRVISMISSFIGIAIVALPTGIITVGFMEELKSSHSNDE